MKVVIDTNVFVSAVFFGGIPHNILNAWNDKKFQLVVSPEILNEYRRVGMELAKKYPGVTLEPILRLVTLNAMVVEDRYLSTPVCADPDDDKFLACALASGAKIITSGDKHLLAVSGFEGVSVLTPRMFAEKFL